MIIGDEDKLLCDYELLIERIINSKIDKYYPDIGTVINNIVKNPFYHGVYKVFYPDNPHSSKISNK